MNVWRQIFCFRINVLIQNVCFHHFNFGKEFFENFFCASLESFCFRFLKRFEKTRIDISILLQPSFDKDRFAREVILSPHQNVPVQRMVDNQYEVSKIFCKHFLHTGIIRFWLFWKKIIFSIFYGKTTCDKTFWFKFWRFWNKISCPLFLKTFRSW